MRLTIPLRTYPEAIPTLEEAPASMRLRLEYDADSGTIEDADLEVARGVFEAINPSVAWALLGGRGTAITPTRPWARSDVERYLDELVERAA